MATHIPERVFPGQAPYEKGLDRIEPAEPVISQSHNCDSTTLD